MKAKDAVGDGGRDNRLYPPDTGGHHNYQQRYIYRRELTRQGAVYAAPVPAQAEPDAISSPAARPLHPAQEIEAAAEKPPENDAQPREVEVRFLEAERAGRAFPCLRGNTYTGCIGYDRCKVLCWSPRLRERQALVRVDKPTGGPCRDCAYAREVLGEVATLNGRQVRLIECRLGFWYGRATVSDYVEGKIALNVQLPCPGFIETDLPHPAVARAREAARRRMRWNQQRQKALKARQATERLPTSDIRS